MRKVTKRELDDAIGKSLADCPGGHYCTCCQSGCDCGCRDDCQVFRTMILKQLVFCFLFVC